MNIESLASDNETRVDFGMQQAEIHNFVQEVNYRYDDRLLAEKNYLTIADSIKGKIGEPVVVYKSYYEYDYERVPSYTCHSYNRHHEFGILQFDSLQFDVPRKRVSLQVYKPSEGMLFSEIVLTDLSRELITTRLDAGIRLMSDYPREITARYKDDPNDTRLKPIIEVFAGVDAINAYIKREKYAGLRLEIAEGFRSLNLSTHILKLQNKD